MPSLAERPCATPGCGVLVGHGHCSAHSRQHERYRGTPAERGYDAAWQEVRAVYLYGSPFCLDCADQHRMRPATEVHHVKPIAARPDLRLDSSNLRGMCKPCHSRITSEEKAKTI